MTVRSITAQSITPPVAGEWHNLLVRAEGSLVSVTINGVVTSVSEIDAYTGSVVFDVRRGSAEFRKSVIRPLPPIAGAYRLGDQAVKGRLVAPKIVEEVAPDYPYAAMRRAVRGVVSLEVTVHEDGSIGPIQINQSPDPLHDLDHAAVAALTRWKFRPGLLDGEPVKVILEIDLTFALR